MGRWSGWWVAGKGAVKEDGGQGMKKSKEEGRGGVSEKKGLRPKMPAVGARGGLTLSRPPLSAPIEVDTFLFAPAAAAAACCVRIVVALVVSVLPAVPPADDDDASFGVVEAANCARVLTYSAG